MKQRYSKIAAICAAIVLSFSACSNSDAVSQQHESSKTITEEQHQEALASITTETDTVEKITWYTPDLLESYGTDRCYVLPYVGEKDGEVWLNIRWNYSGQEFLFIHSGIVSLPEKNYEYSFDILETKMDTGDGYIFEWVDLPGDDEVEMLQALAESDDATIRMEGQTYYYDFHVREEDKDAIQDVLTVYTYMKNQ